jgi:hypothetical protein
MAEELDPFTAEQLLRGEPVDAPLSELLAAAAEPAYADELADEEVVLAAFRSAQSRRPRRALRLKAAIAVLAVAGTGAAAAGTLPTMRGSDQGPSIESGRSVPAQEVSAGTGSQATPSSPPPADRSSGQPSARPSSPAKPSAEPPNRTSRPPVSTSPRRTPPPTTRRPPATAALISLCRSYTSILPRNDRSKDNPAFTVLITVAGGKEQVRGYCERLLGQSKTRPQRSSPSRPPVASRTERSTSQRSGRPTAHPSKRPANPQAGEPATVPTPRAR